mmetsp:Transcript_25332/g.39726  ORF Transcript_25332/g.39726 Transcript_25332/m.39726 type:complete len:126 (-) Transcript_25332:418-795(-)
MNQKTFPQSPGSTGKEGMNYWMQQQMRAKPDIPGSQMAISAGINSFFTVNCLVDMSVTSWAVEKRDFAHLQQACEMHTLASALYCKIRKRHSHDSSPSVFGLEGGRAIHCPNHVHSLAGAADGLL